MEGSPAGAKVLQLIAEDGDYDTLQKITYRITSGNPEGFFAINSSSGESLFLLSVHYTQQPSNVCHAAFVFNCILLVPPRFNHNDSTQIGSRESIGAYTRGKLQ